MLEPKDNPGSFELVRGSDYIEIAVKTVDLGDSSTPGTTMSNSLSTSQRSSNRNSGRRSTTLSNTPFIPESPSAAAANQAQDGSGAPATTNTNRFSFTLG